MATQGGRNHVRRDQVQKIAVVGATGFTGRLVVRALERTGGAGIRLVGRNRERLAGMLSEYPGTEAWPVETWTTDALAEALNGCAAVISCAGPFVQVGRPVVEAALRVEVPYCDSTGEPPFIRWVYEKLDAPARLSGIPLVPAFGFDYVPGDVGAAIAARGLGPLERVDVLYWSASRATSAGTRRSVAGMLSEPGMVLADGSLRRERLGRRWRSVTIGGNRVKAPSIPAGEPLMLPRHLEVRTVVTYLAVPVPRAALPLLRGLGLPGMKTLAGRIAQVGSRGPGEQARAAAFACHVQAQAVDGSIRAVLVEGRDVYGFTATALAELGARMCAGAVDSSGASTPSQAVAPEELAAMTGLTIREVEPEALSEH